MQTPHQNPEALQIITTSPAAHAQHANAAPSGEVKWQVVNGMRMAVAFADHPIEQARKQILGVTDVSCFSRYGVKGPQASRWLADREVAIPSSPNSLTVSHQSSLVLRLGGSEFLIEDQLKSNLCQTLAQDISREAGVYKVPRADAAFALSGSQVLNLFSELCALDLRDKTMSTHEVIMTQVAGVSATVFRQTLNGEPVYRVICDGTYGADMWHVFLEIAVELGGGAVGLACYQH